MDAIEITRRADGALEFGAAAPVIGLSLALIYQRGAADPPWLFVEDGLVCLRGVDAGGKPRELRYRAVGFQAAPAGAEAVNEGGHLICERVG